ncbi:unnamed protein product [Brassica oleracea]
MGTKKIARMIVCEGEMNALYYPKAILLYGGEYLIPSFSWSYLPSYVYPFLFETKVVSFDFIATIDASTRTRGGITSPAVTAILRLTEGQLHLCFQKMWRLQRHWSCNSRSSTPGAVNVCNTAIGGTCSTWSLTEPSASSKESVVQEKAKYETCYIIFFFYLPPFVRL